MASKRSYLWATTAYGPHKIKIFLDPRMVTRNGYTEPVKTGIKVCLSEELLHDPAMFDEVLIHEFVHVLEYLNSEAAFSVVEVDSCTALAQTVGKGLAQLFRELQIAPRLKRK